MILDNGPHTVTVIPMDTAGKDKYGGWKLVRGTPIELPSVSVQPYGAGSLSGLESDDETAVNDQLSIRGRLPWPGGTKSIVIYEGEEYDQQGLAKEYKQGYRTQHFLVRIKRRKAQVK